MIEKIIKDAKKFKGLIKAIKKGEKAARTDTAKPHREQEPQCLTAKEIDDLLEEIHKTMGDVPPPPPKSPEELQKELNEEYKDVPIDEDEQWVYDMYGKEFVIETHKRCNKLRAIIRTSKDPKEVEEAKTKLIGNYLF